MPKTSHQPAAPTRTQWLAAGDRIAAHRHDDHQLVYAGSGALSVTTDAGVWVAPGNRAIWVPAGTGHAHRAYGELRLHLLGVPARENPLGVATPAVLSVSPLLRELIVACTLAEDESGPVRERMGAVLLDQLRLAVEAPLYVPEPRSSLLRQVRDLLHADLAGNRTLGDLGRTVGASERTLSRAFRAELGMTFPQWRTQLRLHHALVLLAGGHSVTATAHQCGWTSVSTFIAAFRATFGHTPGTHHPT